jgi:hypothetical protein
MAACSMSNVRAHSYFADCPRQPQTIGLAFNDSPIGILMWIGEKYNEECDPDLKATRNILTPFSRRAVYISSLRAP